MGKNSRKVCTYTIMVSQIHVHAAVDGLYLDRFPKDSLSTAVHNVPILTPARKKLQNRLGLSDMAV
jgi:hypothetical protein